MVFRANCLFFLAKEQNSDLKRSRHSLKKSNGAKSNESDSFLGIKMGKVVKNCQKHGENNTFFQANRSFFESGGAICPQKSRESLMSLSDKERREQFTYSHSLLKSNKSESLMAALLWRAILSERVNSKEQIPIPNPAHITSSLILLLSFAKSIPTQLPP